jgi:hypothetical protein
MICYQRPLLVNAIGHLLLIIFSFSFSTRALASTNLSSASTFSGRVGRLVLLIFFSFFLKIYFSTRALDSTKVDANDLSLASTFVDAKSFNFFFFNFYHYIGLLASTYSKH